MHSVQSGLCQSSVPIVGVSRKVPAWPPSPEHTAGGSGLLTQGMVVKLMSQLVVSGRL